ncbi:MAG: hypothetical protein E7267_03425 [Lachnospiraceae bacterium]|nr:hypothetical protein [Lachnospiraceae bacterium]
MIIDLHNHILPGVDDGATTLGEAVEMAALAAHCGISRIVATPHYNNWNSTYIKELEHAYAELAIALEYEQIPITLYKSMEIAATDDLPELLKQGEVWTYPFSSYFLVEFSQDEEYDYFDWLLNQCVEAGFTPVIAHPERYHAVRHYPEIAQQWCEKGYGVQINRDSLLGLFGHHSYECADYLLRQGWANCIASDAHSTQTRNSNWLKAFRTFPKTYGFYTLGKCLESTPEKILKNKSLK